MGEIQIISNRDKDGNFVVSSEAWTPDKIEALFNKYNPNRKIRLEKEKLTQAERPADSKKD